MFSMRAHALSQVSDRKPLHIPRPNNKISDYYGINAFSPHVMREFLTDEAYQSVMDATQRHTRIDRKVADQVASAMKEWAISRGATHYTHWFQPLTGATAEKHDSFISPTGDGRAIEKFDGSALVQQEPDASSFPSGGIRQTFEARGYTLWDPSSPAFVFDGTLCIPTIFISYTGHALDYKMPLLKALASIDKAATAVCKYFDRNVTKTVATLGWEQEYFLIDAAFYNARPDISMTGRALFGHASPKGQQLDDHYFGSISERVTAFMKDFEQECHKVGIPVTTRHNEVAPNQFEVAPIFEEANLAVDHNSLLMDIMEKVSRKHQFRVLNHEKPFEGLNGSGKHNNWSLSTNTGVNLLKPGKNPKTNLQFLTFFVNTLKALHVHADVIRAAIASAGNDHRLGANEAPPAIISAFVGSQLSSLLDDIEKNVKAGKMTPEDKTELKLEIGRIPQIMLDNTDRNRTSPFAFTGNKFELRAVGSAANCALPMIVLNTIVADQLIDFKKNVDARMGKGDKRDEAVLKELQKLIKESKAIRFEGDGYSDDWVKEAKKRGLSNLLDTPAALEVWGRKEVAEIFAKHNVFSPEELHSRQDIAYENYVLKRQIEALKCGDIAMNHIIPTAVRYQSTLIDNVRGLTDVLGAKAGKAAAVTQVQLIEDISLHINAIRGLVEGMRSQREKAARESDIAKQSKIYSAKVKPMMDEIREHVDALEMTVDDAIWPLPKLREMLFVR